MEDQNNVDNISTTPQEPKVETPTEDKEGIKNLRKSFAEAQKKLKEYEAREQAEKQKELEAKGEYEKLLESEKSKRLELENKLKEKAITLELEKAFVNVNPELKDLVLAQAKAQAEYQDGEVVNIGEILSDFQQKYKSAFIQESAKPLGTVGTQATSGGVPGRNREDILRDFYDPKKLITPELEAEFKSLGL